MTIVHDVLKERRFADVAHRYDADDTILYALGVGCGAAREDMRYVYERGLEALPSMATILARSDFWIADPESGIDASRAVHGEEMVTLHEAVPAMGTVIGRTHIEAIVDKGPGRPALLHLARQVSEQATGRMLATVRSTVVLLGQGGFGGPRDAAPPRAAMPARPPDRVVDIPTLVQASFIYRLSGDRNPLHVDPEAARAAGFERPILHGLCTFGMVARALVRHCCDDSPDRVREIGARFSAPVYPGDVLRLEIWQRADRIRFRAFASGRHRAVLDHGTARIGRTESR